MESDESEIDMDNERGIESLEPGKASSGKHEGRLTDKAPDAPTGDGSGEIGGGVGDFRVGKKVRLAPGSLFAPGVRDVLDTSERFKRARGTGDGSRRRRRRKAPVCYQLP